MVMRMSLTVCEPPRFIPEQFSTPFFCSQAQISYTAITVGLCFLATSTASPLWSKCPWLMSITSTAFRFVWFAGQAGFSLNHGSITTCLPLAVSMRNVECPYQVRRRPCRSIRFLEDSALAPAPIAAGQRDHILEPHFLQALRRQRRTRATATIEHDIFILVG